MNHEDYINKPNYCCTVRNCIGGAWTVLMKENEDYRLVGDGASFSSINLVDLIKEGIEKGFFEIVHGKLPS